MRGIRKKARPCLMAAESCQIAGIGHAYHGVLWRKRHLTRTAWRCCVIVKRSLRRSRGRLSAIRPIDLIPIQHQPPRLAIDAYKGFDERQASWFKVKIAPVG
jgi:hypothetical protein